MRLQKYLADCGIASRRQAEQLIAQGLVQVNGQTVLEMGVKVSPGDVVTYQGRQVRPEGRSAMSCIISPLGR